MAAPGAHLKKITAAAKKLRKSHPKMAWTDAIKKASKALKKPAKKKAAVKKRAAPAKKRAVRSVGAAPKKKPVVKQVVKRTVKTEKFATIGKVPGRLQAEMSEQRKYEDLLAKARGESMRGKTAKEKAMAARWKKYYAARISSIKKNIGHLKKLI